MILRYAFFTPLTLRYIIMLFADGQSATRDDAADDAADAEASALPC